MRKTTYLILSCLLFLSLLTNASNNIMFDKANQLYHNKNYDSAAQLYQQMINDGYCSSDLYYNAGNAYYRLNHIGLSIWCYEKALSIHTDKNYQENLLLAKKRIREPIEELTDIFFIRWWEGAYTTFNANGWAWLALIFFLLGLGSLFLVRLQQGIEIPGWIKRVSLTISFLCIIMLAVRAYADSYHFNGIIIQPKTLCTFSGKKEPIYLSEGIKIRVVDLNPVSNRSGAQTTILVKLPDGRIGKIDRRSMMKL